MRRRGIVWSVSNGMGDVPPPKDRPGPAPPARSVAAVLFHGGLEAPLYLRRRQVLLAGGDGPDVSEGVGQRAVSIAVELVLQRPERFRAGGDGLVEPRIH